MFKEKLDINNIDITTFIGIIFTLLLIVISINIDGRIASFLDTASILIVILGTFSITTACFSIKDVIKSHYHIFVMAFTTIEEPSNAALNAIKMAIHARNLGTSSLEKSFRNNQYNSFCAKGIEMVVDEVAAEEIEKLYTQSIISIAEQQAKVISILRKSAEIAPAMGLIGTLIGLVQMLGSLSDISKIGPSMALALLTTFYGAVLAYVIFFPLSSKLESNSKERILISRIYLRAIISISKGENPRLLEKEVNSLLSPSNHVYYFKNN